MRAAAKNKILLPAETLVKESDKARCFQIDNEFIWIAKSLTEEFSFNSQNVTFWLPDWLINERRLEIYIDTSDTPFLWDDFKEEHG